MSAYPVSVAGASTLSLSVVDSLAVPDIHTRARARAKTTTTRKLKLKRNNSKTRNKVNENIKQDDAIYKGFWF